MSHGSSQNSETPPGWQFIVYTAGKNAAGEVARDTLVKLCRHYAPDDFSIKIIDVLTTEDDLPADLLATPTVVRVCPLPERRVIGDMSEMEKVAKGLGFKGAWPV